MIEKFATLTDINTSYTVTDILKANALLDMRADVAEVQREKASKQRK